MRKQHAMHTQARLRAWVMMVQGMGVRAEGMCVATRWPGLAAALVRGAGRVGRQQARGCVPPLFEPWRTP